MAWEKTSEEINEAQGVHTLVLEEKTTKPPAKHHLMILIGADCCPTCGHVVPKDNVGELDPKAHLAAEMAALEKSTSAIKAYSKKHLPRR